jgi:hypothetical protein
MTKRAVQCAKCPWKVSTNPWEIPGGYDAEKHRALVSTIAEPGGASLRHNRAMACHEYPIGAERPCAGWLAHQLGPGNNLALRLYAMTGAFGAIVLDGEQHPDLESTLPRGPRP